MLKIVLFMICKMCKRIVSFLYVRIKGNKDLIWLENNCIKVFELVILCELYWVLYFYNILKKFIYIVYVKLRLCFFFII